MMDDIQILVQAGAVGLCFFMMILHWKTHQSFICFIKKQEEIYKNTIDNYIKDEIKMKEKLINSNEKFTLAVKQMLEFLKFVFKNNNFKKQS